MRAVRRLGMTIGLMVVALLPVAAAISPDAPSPADMPMAITQPLAVLPGGPLGGNAGGAGVLPESGLIVLVGTALLGLASVVRRTTRI